MSVRAISSISRGEARPRLPVRAGGIAGLQVPQARLHRQLADSANAGFAAAPFVFSPLHAAALADLLTPP
jgi:hypothetical protein